MAKRGEQQQPKSRKRGLPKVTAAVAAEPSSGGSPRAARAVADAGVELRRYEPVTGELVLAAVDRAVRHDEHGRDDVTLGEIVAHLGFVRTGWTTRGLRPRLDALITSGFLRAARRQSMDVWALTDAGRAHLDSARRTGRVGELPEAPQHRVWRHARANAAELIEPLREGAQAAAEEALELLDARRRMRSDEWLLLAARLGESYRRLALASYCLCEWAEPDDARADIDDYQDPDDEKLDADTRGRLRSLRRFRRSPCNLRLEEEAQHEAAARRLITVAPEMLCEIRSALHNVLGDAAQDISHITFQDDREDHPERYAEQRERLERTCALLDLIGWRAPKQPAVLRLDLRRHAPALLEALDVRLLLGEDELKEADAVDAERAKRKEPPKRAQTVERVRAVREFATTLKDLLADQETKAR
jgi:hypothetical protein